MHITDSDEICKRNIYLQSKKVGIDFEKNIDISVVTCYHVKKQMTENKIKEQKEYLYGTALQRVGDGEIPAGKYKGNGFVRCKANTGGCKCK